MSAPVPGVLTEHEIQQLESLGGNEMNPHGGSDARPLTYDDDRLAAWDKQPPSTAHGKRPDGTVVSRAMPDSQGKQVYAAEEAFEFELFDQGLALDAEQAGSSEHLARSKSDPIDLSLPNPVEYIESVLGSEWCAERFPDYNNRPSAEVLDEHEWQSMQPTAPDLPVFCRTAPDHGEMRSTVYFRESERTIWKKTQALHELAHGLIGGREGHGPAFCRVYLDLVEEFLGPTIAGVLEGALADLGCQIGSP